MAWAIGQGVSASPNTLRKEYYTECLNNSRLELPIRLQAADALMSEALSAPDNILLDKILRTYIEAQQLNQAEKIIIKGWDLTSSWEPSRASFLAYWDAWLKFYQHRYADAFAGAVTLIALDKPDSLLYRNIDGHILLTDLYFRIGNREMARQCHTAAMSAFEQPMPVAPAILRERKAILLQQQGSLYQMDGKFDKAYATLKQARALNASTHLNVAIAGEMGSLFRLSGNDDIAETYYTEALGIVPNDVNHPANVLNLAVLKLEQDGYVAADSVLDTYSRIVASIKGGPLMQGLLLLRCEISLRRGDVGAALEYSRQAASLADSIHAQERKIYDAEISKQFDKELARLSQDRHNYLVLKVCGCCAGLVVMSLMAFFHIRRLYLRTTVRAGQILDFDRVWSNMRKESRQNDELSRKLCLQSLRMEKLTEALVDIRRCSSQGSLNDKSRLLKIREILKEISLQENSWELFSQYFEQINVGFFARLYHIQPNLTNAEVRMCALIVMNLTTKEIADLTNRSTRTVETIKYNLRKKLGITGSTEQFLCSLSSRGNQS